MYHRGIQWDDYLARYGFKDTIGYTLDRKTSAPPGERLDRGFGRLIASQPQMYVVRQTGFAAVSYTLSRLTGGIAQLGVDFDWAMGGALWKLDLTQSTHDPLQTLLAELEHTLEEPHRACYHRAQHAYLDGRYDEALNDLHTLAQHEIAHFGIYQTLGHIALYYQQPASLNTACHAYLKAARCAEQRSPACAALAYLYAAFVCYLQEKDDEAIRYAMRATTLDDTLSEAWYTLAKFAAVARQVTTALPVLERIIRANQNYAVKVRDDLDFETIEADITALIDQLTTEVEHTVQEQWQHLQACHDDADLAPEDQCRIADLQPVVEALLRKNTYFSYLEALEQLEACQDIRKHLQQQAYHQACQQMRGEIARLRAEMAACDMLDGVRQLLDGELQAAETILSSVNADDKIEYARQKLHYCERSLHGGVLTGHTHLVYTLAFSPDSQTLASGSADATVRLWDIASGRECALLKGHNEPIALVLFSPTGARLASASADATVRLWSVPDGVQRCLLEGHSSGVITLAFSPDSQTLASGSVDKTICFWDVGSGDQRVASQGHTHRVTVIAFSPDGRLLASGASDNTIRLWDGASGEPLATMHGHAGSIRSLAFSLDGQVLASASSDTTVRLWDVGTATPLATMRGHTAPVKLLAFSPDGHILASASSDATIRLWNVTSHTQQAVLRGHTGSIHGMAFNPGGAWLASASADTTVRLWSVPAGVQRAVLRGHTDAVNTLAFSPNGAILASGSSDRTVRLWHTALPHQQHTLEHTEQQFVQSKQHTAQCHEQPPHTG